MQLALQCLMVLSVVGEPATREFQLSPPAAWVELHQLAPAPAGELGAPLQKLLIESQVRVTAESVEEFSRTATKVLSPTGMGAVSQVELTFDPSYEQLTIHAVWIHRLGQRLDALVPNEIKVIQQEKELERRLYNGTLTAVLFLKDVRIGDTVEVLHTVSGQNAIHAGHFADHFGLASTTSVERIFRRLLYPESMPIFLKPHGTSAQPVVTVKDGVRDYRWDLHNVPAIAHEGSLPPWVDPWPWVQVSSFADWNAVALWAVGLFTPAADSPEDLARTNAQIEDWMKTQATAEARLLAATRFVQDDVRYMGIEMGANSHQPHAPTQVFNQRFGDCKDKALLLVTLLRRMGIKADPALVSSGRQRGILEDHPWPFAFDHAIVRAELDGHEVWIDGTASLERGRLVARAPPPFERALLVQADAGALIEIPAETLAAPTSDVEEKYELSSDGSATLHVHSSYIGSDAHSMRHRIASTTRDDLQKHYLNVYAKEDPSVAITAPMEILDDVDDNRIELRQHYAFKAFWLGAPRELYPTSFEDELARPWTSVRTMPLYVEPRHVRHVIEVNRSALDQVPDPSEKTVNGPASKETFQTTLTGTGVRLDFTYQTVKEVVEAQAIKPYLDSLDEMRRLGFMLPAPLAAMRLPVGAERDRVRTRGLIISGIFFAAVIGFFVWQRRSAAKGTPKPRRYQR